jgi:hypothetical protein
MSRDFPVEERFGEVVTGENWGIVPYALYKYQGTLGLEIADIWLLTWLCMHTWDERDTFPSINAMTRYTDKSRSYIQRIARRLEKKCLITIKERWLENGARLSNFYDISPLISILEKQIKGDPYSKWSKEHIDHDAPDDSS